MTFTYVCMNHELCQTDFLFETATEVLAHVDNLIVVISFVNDVFFLSQNIALTVRLSKITSSDNI